MTHQDNESLVSYIESALAGPFAQETEPSIYSFRQHLQSLTASLLVNSSDISFGNILTYMETPSETSQATLNAYLSTQASTSTRRIEHRQINGTIWSLVEHPANIRRNSHTSRIWDHGGEYANLQAPNSDYSWICDHCNSVIKLARSQTRWNISRHLRKAHKIETKREISEVEEEGDEEDEAIKATHSEGFRTLVTRIDIERFRRLLVRWIVQGQIPFSAVKLAQFRDLLICLQPGIERYLVRSPTTMKSWIDDEYRRARQQVKVIINASLSRIHLSFDIWTSPSCSAIVGICAHFLSPNL